MNEVNKLNKYIGQGKLSFGNTHAMRWLRRANYRSTLAVEWQRCVMDHQIPLKSELQNPDCHKEVQVAE